MDKIDAIAAGIASITPLSAPVNQLHERARASLIDKALDLAGFVIVPKEPTEAMFRAYWDRCGPDGSLRDERREHNDYPHGDIRRAFQAMVAAAYPEPKP